MPRHLFEFERGKGSRLDWQQENVAVYGPRSSYMNRSFKRGLYRPTSRREGVVYPLRWYPVIRKHDIYLAMRSRIGHGHFKGLRPNL
jgi:hypothetical protein